MGSKNTSQALEFLFLGNDLALDFVNTRRLIGEVHVELLTDFEALLRWFKTARQLAAPEVGQLNSNWGASGRASHTLQAMREFREELRSQLLNWENGRSISSAFAAELNVLMSRHPMLNRIKKERDRPAVELWFEKDEPEQLFAPLAYRTAMLFVHADPSSFRKCDNCILHFLDTSKKGTRRWCSMQLCGNRFKVAAYAARHGR